MIKRNSSFVNEGTFIRDLFTDFTKKLPESIRLPGVHPLIC
ncbi:hypothetical protein CLOSTHATH_01100 [Hungatella hathewayi DSM 13479]|uniref:Uncharacterized protein n=1 Tax=Hungatella hathewayi DSM 13479 TaxID=566550 RepID=D3ABX2_9FIRM|nr:hypothetical protein CLOSTHATH_01100 [Hungatella hathewayi DSM 13479]